MPQPCFDYFCVEVVWICFQVIFYGFYHGKDHEFHHRLGNIISFFLSMKQAASRVGECWLNTKFSNKICFFGGRKCPLGSKVKPLVAANGRQWPFEGQQMFFPAAKDGQTRCWKTPVSLRAYAANLHKATTSLAELREVGTLSVKNTDAEFTKEAGSSFFQDVIETLKRNCQVSTSSMHCTAWKSAFDDVRNGGEK